jgi:hypothetical protein
MMRLSSFFNGLFLAGLWFGLTACESTKSYVASPSLGQIETYVGKAEAKAQVIYKQGARPGDRTTSELLDELKGAKETVRHKQAELDEAVDYANERIEKLSKETAALNKALNRSDKMLLAGILLAPLVFWLGILFKHVHPVSSLIPNVFAGYLFLFLVGAFWFVVMKVWRLFGFLFLLIFLCFLSDETLIKERKALPCVVAGSGQEVFRSGVGRWA